MNDRLLTEATVQELHLELLRRTMRNALDGEEIHDDLLAMRELWNAVLLDTGGLDAGYGRAGLIKLRDLADNCYNVDTLYILTENSAAAHKIARYGERWLADTVHIAHRKATSSALGSSDLDMQLVTMWWD